MERRDFMKSAGGSAAALCCGVGVLSFLEGCSPVLRLDGVKTDLGISVATSHFIEQQFAVINHKDLSAPIYLTKVKDDEFRAFVMTCTHKQCELRATGTFMSCPCHGSEFSNIGEVINGPAEQPLPEYKTSLTSESVLIDTLQPVKK